MPLRPIRLALAVAAAVLAAPLAPAQTVYTWNDTDPNWPTATNWTPNAPAWTTSGNNHIGLFGAQATIANQPTIASGDTVFALGVSVNNGGGASWNLGGAGTLVFQGSGLYAGGTLATAGAVRGLDVYGGGTTTIDVATRIGANGQAWYTTGGSRTVVNTALTGLAGTESLILRTASTSSWQFNAAAGAIGAVTLATTNGGTTARYEIGADNVFGTNALAVTGGGGNTIVLQAVGADRTLGNSSVNFTNYNITFVGSQSLTLAGPATSNNTGGSRILTSNTTGGASAIFAGSFTHRAATDATADARNLVLAGTGRFDFNGPMLNGGTLPAGQVNGLLVGSTTGSTPTVRLASAASDFNGNTQVLGGTLLIGANAPNAANGALGNSNLTVAVGSTVVGGVIGTQPAAVLIDADGVTVGRSFNVRSTFTGTATMGSSAVNSTTAFQNAVAIGTDGNAADRSVTLTAPTGATVTFAQINRFGTTYTGQIGLIKEGAGTVVVNNTGNAPNALVAVNAGTLVTGGDFDAGRGVTVAAPAMFVVNGTLTAAGSANAVAVAGTLGGTGTVNHPVTVASAGTVAPGGPAALGTLTVADRAVAFAAGSNLSVRLGPTASPAADALNVSGTGTLNFATGTNLRLAALGFAPLPGGEASVTYSLGTVAALQIDGTGTGGDAQLGRFVAGTGNTGGLPVLIDPSLISLNAGDQLLFNYTGGVLALSYVPVPEPTAMLAAAALAGLGLRAARRRRTA